MTSIETVENDRATRVTPTRFVLLAESMLPFAPTWRVTIVGVDAPNSAMPLNVAESRIRTSSAVSCVISAPILAWSPVDSVPFDHWMASSRTRCRIECISFRAPSAVCTSEMPSWALRLAWAVPRIWARMPSEIARPAASSAARLMRRPDESFSMDFDSAMEVLKRLRWALNASTFVFTRRDI